MGHGHDKGELASYFDDYDLNDDPGDPPFLHAICFKCDDEDRR